MKHSLDANSLISWFQEEKRDFPWREDPTPYKIWVSEVMLQQTRAQVVVPYFERWMDLFPTVEQLAQASLDEVLKTWEGLGYYSRARNLWNGAKTIVSRYGGQLPSSEQELSQIQGLGPYTIGAILSFAFHQKAPAVDGNVLRVISRYCLIEDDIAKQKTVHNIRKTVASLLPEENHWVVSEALIELGATICGKKPECKKCPLKSSCQSFRFGKQTELPFKSTRYASFALHRMVAVIHCGNHYLFRQGKKGEIMQDLYEFPYADATNPQGDVQEAAAFIKSLLQIEAVWQQDLPCVTHTFTKYRATLIPYRFSTNAMPEVAGHLWLPLDKAKNFAFSSGHKQIFSQL